MADWSGMTTSLAADQQIADFDAWLPDDLELHVALKREDSQWFALLLEFDITGCGETRAEAVRQSFELLTAYLQEYFEEGAEFGDTLRPVPGKLRLQITVESAVARALRRTMVKLPLADESTYALPPGLLRFATA
jgi:hypothetical protein